MERGKIKSVIGLDNFERRLFLFDEMEPREESEESF